jgi:4'-phosphopantetheinyl transferase
MTPGPGTDLIPRSVAGPRSESPAVSQAESAAVPAVLPPPPGQVHLWLVPVTPSGGRPELLDPAERRRADGLPDGYARHTLLTSRSLQRLVGARYLGVAPEEVRIDRRCQHCGAGHGRPRFVGGGVDYSVSHTRDWVLLAVVGTGLIGVDLERRDADRDTDGLAAIALTAAERTRFAALSAPDRPDWFLAAWTRKEAAMKLAGLGLRAAPGRLDVRGATVRADRVAGWPAVPVHLRDLAAPEHHVAALASTVPVTEVRTYELPELAGS